MHVARDRQSHRSDTGTIDRRPRHQWRVRMSLIEVLNNRERLRDSRVLNRQSRHQRLWIDRTVIRPLLIAGRRPQIYIHSLVRNAFEVKGDPRAVSRRTAEVVIQLHLVTGATMVLVNDSRPSM